eukprot:g54743.t1
MPTCETKDEKKLPTLATPVTVVKVLSQADFIQSQDWSMLETPLLELLLYAVRKGKINAADERGQTALMLAAQSGHTQLVRWLIEDAHAIVNKQCYAGWMALQLAVDHAKPELVRLLLRHGAEVNHAAPNGATALMLAARRGCLPVLDMLLKAGAKLDATSDNGWTAVMFAAFAGKADALSMLLAADPAMVNTPDRDGATPLIIAAENGRLDAVQTLLDAKAALGQQAHDGTCAVSCAAHAGHVEVVQLLLARGAPRNQQSTRGWSALMFAAIENRVDVLRLLVAAGFAVEHAASDGATALHVAALAGSTETYEVLLQQPPPPVSLSTQLGEPLEQPPLDPAAAPRAIENAGLDCPADSADLLAMPAHLRPGPPGLANSCSRATGQRTGWSSNSAHTSPLKTTSGYMQQRRSRETKSAQSSPSYADRQARRAGLWEHSELKALRRRSLFTSLRRLHSVSRERKIAHVALDLQTNQGWTALMVAAHERNRDAVKALIAHGADVNVRSKEGWSALMLAINAGDADICRVLLSSQPPPDIYTPSSKGTCALGLVQPRQSDVVYELVRSGLLEPQRCPAWWLSDADVCAAAERALLTLYTPVLSQALLAGSQPPVLPDVLLHFVAEYAVPTFSEAICWSKEPAGMLVRHKSMRQAFSDAGAQCTIN